MAPATRLVLLIGWIGYALLPWYLVEGMGLTRFGWLAGYPLGKAGSALALALSGQAPWLLPPGLALLAATAFAGSTNRRRTATVLIAAGALGMLLFFAQAFAIVLKDQGMPALAALLGGAGAAQRGMGGGAFLTLLSLLLLLCHGLAYRGVCRGDLFTTSSIGIVVLLIGLFIFFPVWIILKSALIEADGTFAPAAFFARFFDSTIWGLGCVTSGTNCGVAWNTLVLAVLCGVITTLLGLACALLILRTGMPGKRIMRALTVLPIITPPFVIGLALILLFGRAGAISTLLYEWFAIPRSRWLYGLPGVLLAQVLAFAPIAFLVLIGVVQGIAPSLEEASQTLGARRWQTFRTVTWPLLRPGIANAFLLGFVESMADFGNPLVLGGNFEVLSTKIFFAVVGASYNQGQAAVLAIILLAFTLGAFWIQQRWLGNRSYTTVTGKGDAGLPTPLPRRITWLAAAAIVPWVLLTVVIYLVILVGGFVRNMGRDFTPTLEHYRTGFAIDVSDGLFFEGSAWSSFFTTVKVAAISAPLTALIGLLTAYLLTRQRFHGRAALEFATMLSFAIPGTVLGVAYILAFNVPPIEITGTGLILVIAFVFRNMPVGVRSGIAGLSQIDKSLDEASTTLRARSFTTLTRVVLPLLKPALVSALVYSFVRSMTAVSAVIFLVSAEYNLSTAYIVGRVEAGEFGLAIAYSSALIVFMALGIVLIQLLVGERKLGRRSRVAAVAAPAPAPAIG
ncbi:MULTISPECIES: iron ABC transporter permease [unclassified Bosea (in: a-proteobacteria)]|uniref:ABC transporter permease n=1 Tax=unclassified Bosea (in: a-proteobacteria) TaxID=2653178 RepID=UPI00095529BF|nr:MULTISPECIES: iron ABC transporter permease [unclassified Bosea (in: a-proteobacteria)]TAJ30648.1 MAG: iron ABC transporter permease [Bosea sp. (in: a-proteobacteria)]SIQ86773.1 iron(III) transport system permease protein [Bosea sp. TND4EK4]